MSILLDTNFLIGLLRGGQSYWQYFEQLLEQTAPFVSTVTRAEIYAGCHPSEEAETKTLLSCLRAVPVNSAIADMAGRYVYRFGRRGMTLHLEDALIGATAVHDQLILVTQNVRDFPMLVPDKNLIQFPDQ
ncbi:MAG TPA: type II toxin-antitoxin system VapC family toxin [Methylomirabilota bacterium]|nr:type II toxin-antitoxin system VapC family toxin [Methylomirabilota bacterium]